jgi:hypothetical protein
MFGITKTQNVWNNKNTKCLELQKHKMFIVTKTSKYSE